MSHCCFSSRETLSCGCAIRASRLFGPPKRPRRPRWATQLLEQDALGDLQQVFRVLLAGAGKAGDGALTKDEMTNRRRQRGKRKLWIDRAGLELVADSTQRHLEP